MKKTLMALAAVAALAVSSLAPAPAHAQRGLGAGAEGFVHDRLDGAGATAALGAATETSIHLARRTRGTRSTDGFTDVVVGEDVAGTNDHGMKAGSQVRTPFRYLRPAPDAKGKHRFSSDSKLRQSPCPDWN